MASHKVSIEDLTDGIVSKREVLKYIFHTETLRETWVEPNHRTVTTEDCAAPFDYRGEKRYEGSAAWVTSAFPQVAFDALGRRASAR